MFRSENAATHNARQACYLCLNPHDGVDTEQIIDYEGVLFLCRGCIKSLAETVGFAVDIDRSDEIADLIAQLDQAREDRNTAESIVIQLEKSAKDAHKHRMERVRAAKVQSA